MRAHRRMPSRSETVTFSAADPLNLVGVIVPGERIPAISSRTVSFRDGLAVEMSSAEPADEDAEEASAAAARNAG